MFGVGCYPVTPETFLQLEKCDGGCVTAENVLYYLAFFSGLKIYIWITSEEIFCGKYIEESIKYNYLVTEKNLKKKKKLLILPCGRHWIWAPTVNAAEEKCVLRKLWFVILVTNQANEHCVLQCNNCSGFP